MRGLIVGGAEEGAGSKRRFLIVEDVAVREPKSADRVRVAVDAKGDVFERFSVNRLGEG